MNWNGDLHIISGEEGMEFMCRAFEETRNEKAIWIAKNLIEAGKMTFEEIAKACGLTIEKVQELARTKTA
jgi:predicted HTH domain antitoxin